jgi:adenylate cyclase
LNRRVQRRLIKLLPLWITGAVVIAVCLLQGLLAQFPSLDFLGRAELFTFDLRARLALQAGPPVATNLAVIYIDTDSLDALNSKELGQFRWPWPRSVFGRLVKELNAEGAKVVGMDLFAFGFDRFLKEDAVEGLSSDEYFARQLAAAGNVVLATTADELASGPVSLNPVPDLFRTNAWAIGHDGLRDLSEMNRGLLRKVPAFVDDPTTGQRVWHMGIVMAAKALEMDLKQAVVERDRIVFPTQTDTPRVMPVDDRHEFYIDWTIGPPGLQPNAGLVEQRFVLPYTAGLLREAGQPGSTDLQGRVVLIGFAATGRKASDWGPTPVAQRTPLFLSHLNVANSMITGRFIQRASPAVERLLIAALAAVAALLGWRLRVGWGVAVFLAVAALYFVLAIRLYVAHRYWLPVAAPLGGALVMGYVCLMSYRVVVERSEQRLLRSAFEKMVSPNVFNLLLRNPALATGGTRREVSVYFADMRGFTRFVEERHAHSLARLREQRLAGAAANAVIDQEARDTLETVNLYLGKVADLVKAYDGTLDKYIGDCVMSFWGAPIANEHHALSCVQAAIAVHKAVHGFNQERLMENERLQRENIGRLASGQPAQEPWPILRVGSAINSGVVTVGFMGSPAHISNYTVFGREVNIASRLDDVVGPERIFVTEATCAAVRRDAPELAATFIKLGPMTLAGLPEPVPVYEVPWQSAPGAA